MVTNCPDCTRLVSDSAGSCPHCGYRKPVEIPAGRVAELNALSWGCSIFLVGGAALVVLVVLAMLL